MTVVRVPPCTGCGAKAWRLHAAECSVEAEYLAQHPQLDYEHLGPCPECGGEVDWTLTCPGYGQPKSEGGSGVMVCASGCSNATKFYCTESDCRWLYITPYNQYRKVYGVRPAWLLDGWQGGM